MSAASAAAPPAPTGAGRFLVLIGAIIVQLILGTVYGYSIFWEPLEAEVYPRIVTQEAYDAAVAAGQDVAGLRPVPTEADVATERASQQGRLKYAFAIAILSFALVMVIAGRVQDIKGPRFTATIGAVLMGLGFLLAGLMSHPIVFYIAHAAFAGAVTLVLLMLFEALFAGVPRERYPILRHVPLAIVTAVVVAGVVLGGQYVGRSGELDKLLLIWGTIGFLAGAGIGFAYVCPIAALIRWFPRHKGLVSGLAVAGFGFGAYLFSLKQADYFALGFISSHGVVRFFLVHALVCFVAVTLGAMLLRNPPGWHSAPAAAADTTWQQTLRRPAFYVLWLMFFSGALAGLMVIGIVKVFAGEQLVEAARSADPAGWVSAALAAARESRGAGFAGWRAGFGTDAQAAAAWIMLKGAAAVGWLAIFNAVGRIVWGFVSDRIGRTLAFVAMFLFQAVVMFILIRMHTELTLGVAAALVGFNFGGNFALFPSATADLFGARNLGANYGWVFTSYGIAGVAGIYAGNTAKLMTGSYGAAFALAGTLCVVSAVLAIGLHVARRRAAA